ncbi:MAG: amidophosphoribosyltransferase [Myxococcales bacterium]|nr:amidophosphoribosyltransferase [Myxococcales bacterium]
MEAWPTADDPFGHPREACGVVGIAALAGRRVDAARAAFFALYALQHRGQESAGIATQVGDRVHIHRGMGLVAQVFTEDSLAPLQGPVALGHTRYSTTGSSVLANAQPYLIETLHGPLALAHNGNVTNARALRRALLARGVGLVSTSDSEVLTLMLAEPAEGEDGVPDWPARLDRIMTRVQGAFSLVVLAGGALYALRDPLGLRPLCLGELIGGQGEVVGHIVASESAAFGTVGARFVREVAPGEILRLDADGVARLRAPEEARRPALCVFEYVYFARPDSQLEGRDVYMARMALGRELAAEHPADADLVIGVPDSATPAAMGYAAAVGLPYGEGLMKNRYIGRTFIQPGEALRRSSVRLKYNPIRENLAGRRVVLVDDSIVRGNTMGPLVRLLRQAGATAVHVRISSPPVRHPCFMGIDLASHAELVADRLSVDEVCAHIGADSLGYLSVEGMGRAVGTGPRRGHCAACFTGDYPVNVDEHRGERG